MVSKPEHIELMGREFRQKLTFAEHFARMKILNLSKSKPGAIAYFDAAFNVLRKCGRIDVAKALNMLSRCRGMYGRHTKKRLSR